MSDGAYVKYGEGKIKFIRVPSPSPAEIERITKVARRVHRYLEKRMHELECDDLLAKEPLLAKCYAASIRYLSVLGTNSGKPLLRLISPELIQANSSEEGTVMGFNLHASPAIEAHDREVTDASRLRLQVHPETKIAGLYRLTRGLVT